MNKRDLLLAGIPEDLLDETYEFIKDYPHDAQWGVVKALTYSEPLELPEIKKQSFFKRWMKSFLSGLQILLSIIMYLWMFLLISLMIINGVVWVKVIGIVLAVLVISYVTTRICIDIESQKKKEQDPHYKIK